MTLLQDTHFNLINDFATLIMLVSTLALQSIINYFRNLKPKKLMKMTMDSIANEFNLENPDSIICKIKSIEKELTTNGGSSIKDMVIRTHENVNTMQTDIKRINSAQRSRMEMIMNQSKDCLFICNENGDLIFANDAMKELYGMNDLSGRNGLRAITDQQTRLRIKTSWEQAIKEKITFREEFEIMNQLDRTKRYNICVTIQPIWDDEHEFTQFSGSVKMKQS